jgi:hypothetical protein
VDSLSITGEEAMKRLRQPKVRSKRRKRFQPQWVKLPARWIRVLRQSSSASTYQLAHTILVEAFTQEYTGREIVLSTEVTGMPRPTRARAIDELVRLKLIRVRKEGQKAVRVTSIIGRVG